MAFPGFFFGIKLQEAAMSSQWFATGRVLESVYKTWVAPPKGITRTIYITLSHLEKIVTKLSERITKTRPCGMTALFDPFTVRSWSGLVASVGFPHPFHRYCREAERIILDEGPVARRAGPGPRAWRRGRRRGRSLRRWELKAHSPPSLLD